MDEDQSNLEPLEETCNATPEANDMIVGGYASVGTTNLYFF